MLNGIQFPFYICQQFFVQINLFSMKSICILSLAGLLCLFACTKSKNADSAQAPAAPTPEELVKKGEYLVQITGCNDCHSPKRMGPNGPEIIPELMLSGYPATQPLPEFDKALAAKGIAQFTPDLSAACGPWGITCAANLTPDDTGIGTWTEEQFKTALTKGKYKGMENGRTLLPPMPWVNYTQMKDEDVKAIFAYLKSIKPVKNVVPAPVPPAG